MAGQFEDSFSPPRLQCWTVPRPPPKLPTPRPPTQFIADDRGHLLPHVPRSQVSPWGTFLGTWDMPRRIPPAWLDLSARSARAAMGATQSQPRALLRACNGICTRVTGQSQPRALLRACNGICTCVTGQLQEPWDETELSGMDQGGPSRGSPQPETPNPPGGGPCPQNP